MKTKKTTTKESAKKDKPAKEKKLSALNAAAKVLADTATAMNTKEMIEAMSKKGYWSSPGGRTPHATLYSAIIREIANKGKESRFKKTEAGQFAATGVTTTTKTKKSAKAKDACPACGVAGFAKGGKCEVCGHESTKAKGSKGKKAKTTTASAEKPAD
jgi:HB1, ASXL, restriction endonuclease HTH domain